MAKKILKTRTQFTSTLRTDLYGELQQMSKETQIPISRLLDTAVQPLILQHTLIRGMKFHPQTKGDEHEKKDFPPNYYVTADWFHNRDDGVQCSTDGFNHYTDTPYFDYAGEPGDKATEDGDPSKGSS